MANPCGVLGVVVLPLALSLSACGESDFSTDDVGSFLFDYEPQLLIHIEDIYRNSGSQYIIHVDFRPNDFGYMARYETQRSFSRDSTIAALKGRGPFAEETLPAEASALHLRTNFADPRILAALGYRHTSADRAVLAFQSLFDCRGGLSRRNKLHQTFILGSAGSHGVDELERFSAKLGRVCGRKVDFAILGDAIGKPGPFPKNSFSHLHREGSCVHFYQRNDLLAGAPMQNCVNVKLNSGSSHSSVAELGLKVSSFLLERLEFHDRYWVLRSLGTLNSFSFFSYSFDFEGYYTKWFHRDLKSFWSLVLSDQFVAHQFASAFMDREWKENPHRMKRALNSFEADDLRNISKKFWAFSDQAKVHLKSYLESHSDPEVREIVMSLRFERPNPTAFAVSKELSDLLKSRVVR